LVWKRSGEAAGFRVLEVEDAGKFTHIWALKAGKPKDERPRLRFWFRCGRTRFSIYRLVKGL